MTNLQKALLGVGAVASVGVAVYAVKKSTERKYMDVARDDNGETVVNQKERDISERIKDAAIEKANKIMTWVLTHKEQIEVVSTALGLAGGAFSIINAVKEYKRGDDTAEKINQMYDTMQAYILVWGQSDDRYEQAIVAILNKLDELTTKNTKK